MTTIDILICSFNKGVVRTDEVLMPPGREFGTLFPISTTMSAISI